jgi:hypothetical protein
MPFGRCRAQRSQVANAENLPIPGTEWNTPEQPARFQSSIPGGDFMNEISRSFAENVPVVGPLVDRGAQAAGSQIAAMITGRTPEEEQADRDRLRAADMRDQPIAQCRWHGYGLSRPAHVARTDETWCAGAWA